MYIFSHQYIGKLMTNLPIAGGNIFTFAIDLTIESIDSCSGKNHYFNSFLDQVFIIGNVKNIFLKDFS